jgi:proteasome accessory factor A
MKAIPMPSTTVAALPKLCGADIELGNFITGVDQVGGTGFAASRALLAEIDGLPKLQNNLYGGWGAALQPHNISRPKGSGRIDLCVSTASYGYNPQDLSRCFITSNGGCAYIDLDHVELCLPEVRSAFDHVAAWHAMLRIARIALDSANAARPTNQRIRVLVNNSDGLGNSYGSHLNFLISQRTFDNIFSRKPHYLQFLASFQVSSILLTGQGKVGSENGQPSIPYQISQRADFFETLQGVQTTYDRPIVNSRDEPLCGQFSFDDPSASARLHVIFFDSAIAHGSALFRVGPMQLILTLLELGLVNPRLILDDPLTALQCYSRDPTLKAHAELISGERLTALELQQLYIEETKRYAAQGVFDGVVSRAGEIIAAWEDTLNKFANSDWMAVARRGIDWVLKKLAIERAMEQRPELEWNSHEVKVIDHLYSSLDDDGLYWSYEASGFVEQLVTPDRIAHFMANPPEDTRAWTRAMLLRRAMSENVEVDSVDWDRITFKLRGRHNWPTYRTLNLTNPLGFTQAEAQPILENSLEFAELLDGVDSLSTGEAQIPSVLSAN